MFRSGDSSMFDPRYFLDDSDVSKASKTTGTEEVCSEDGTEGQEAELGETTEAKVLYKSPIWDSKEGESSEDTEQKSMSTNYPVGEQSGKKQLKGFFKKMGKSQKMEKTELKGLFESPADSHEVEELSEKEKVYDLYASSSLSSLGDDHSKNMELEYMPTEEHSAKVHPSKNTELMSLQSTSRAIPQEELKGLVASSTESKVEKPSEQKELKRLYIRPTSNRSCSSSELGNLVDEVDDGCKLRERPLFSIGHKVPDTWKSPEHRKFFPEKANLYDGIVGLARDGVQTNSIVIIDEHNFPVQLLILQCYSGMFRDIGNEMTIELPGEMVTPRAFGVLYEWMIDTEPALPRDGLLEVLQASHFLKIPQLIAQCESCLTNNLKEASAALLYLEAKELKLDFNHEQMLQRISLFFLTFVASNEFLGLLLKPLCKLLASDRVAVNSELEVFMVAVRWLNHEWPKREGSIARVASFIRFGLIQPWVLIRLQQTDNEAVEVQRILSHPLVRKGLHDGIAYTTERIFYCDDREAFKQHLQKTGGRPPKQRTWIYDRNCRHHHRLNCKHSVQFSFETFVEYLNYVQCQHRDYWQSYELTSASDVCLNCQPKPDDSERGQDSD